MSDAAPGHQTETGDAEHNAVSDDTGDDTDAVARAHSHLTAYRNQVALLNHLTTNGLQIQDTHIKDTESVDGTLVSIDAVVPDDWLESAPDRGRPDRASRHEHEATQLDDIESSIQGLEAHVDAISDRLDTFEDRLDSFEANTTDDPDDNADADTGAFEYGLPKYHVPTTETDSPTDASQDPTPTDTTDSDTTDDADSDTTDDADSDPDSDDAGDTELTAGELRSELLATAFDDVADSISYFDKADWRALAETHVDAEFDANATNPDLMGALADAYDLEIDMNASGQLHKADVRALHDAIIQDEPAVGGIDTATDGDEQGSDGAGDVDPEPDAHEDTETDASNSNPDGKNRMTLVREVALALGVEPPTGTTTAPKHVLRDVVAALTNQSVESLAPLEKDALRQELADFQSVDEWWGHNAEWRDLHETVVPDARLDDPIDWDALDAHVDIPAWLGEGTLVEAVGESESIRDLEHTLGWDGDRRQLRCITWLAGWYSDLPEPEAKHDPKYTPGGGA